MIWVVGVYQWSNRTVFSAKHHLSWCLKYRHRVPAGRVEVRLGDVESQKQVA